MIMNRDSMLRELQKTIDELYKCCGCTSDVGSADELPKVNDGSDLMCVDPSSLPPEDPNDLVCMEFMKSLMNSSEIMSEWRLKLLSRT